MKSNNNNKSVRNEINDNDWQREKLGQAAEGGWNGAWNARVVQQPRVKAQRKNLMIKELNMLKTLISALKRWMTMKNR